ncbi:MAG: ATP synthase F1 subunit delta [Anaerolineaceae bacterium]|nr:ATP synthase F1 subunit delta [Anaerolineaceae bacterium]
MAAQELPRKYAMAVFSLAVEKWVTALKATQDKIAEDASLLKKLQNTDLSFGERQKALDKVIPAESDPYVHNFLYTMLRDGDISLLGEIIDEIGRMTSGGPQVQVARVTTAAALSEAEQDQFRQKLRSKYGQNLEFVFNVDSSILGGAVVQVGDKIIDGSVATRLQSMSNLLGVR